MIINQLSSNSVIKLVSSDKDSCFGLYEVHAIDILNIQLDYLF